MTKLLITSLLLLIAIKSYSFTPADTGSYSSADLISIDIQDCVEEIELQYTDGAGLIDYTNITLKDIEEMEKECIRVAMLDASL